MAYGVFHNDFWNKNRSNWGQHYIGRYRSNAASYDSIADPVAWMPKSPYVGGSEAHLNFNLETEAMARRIVDLLNAD